MYIYVSCKFSKFLMKKVSKICSSGSYWLQSNFYITQMHEKVDISYVRPPVAKILKTFLPGLSFATFVHRWQFYTLLSLPFCAKIGKYSFLTDRAERAKINYYLTSSVDNLQIEFFYVNLRIRQFNKTMQHNKRYFEGKYLLRTF